MSVLISRNDEHFYFDANIVVPLVLKKRELRSELEYDADVFPEKTALKYLEQISECFAGKVYLLTVSQEIAPRSKVRSKKGMLWQEEELRELNSRNWEIDVSDGKSRLVSLINLDGFNYGVSETLVLNWLFSLIILSEIDMDVLRNHVEEWVAKGESGVLAYDYDAVAKSLVELESTVVLRYFPADNGRSEMLVVVGNRRFIDKNVESCITGV